MIVLIFSAIVRDFFIVLTIILLWTMIRQQNQRFDDVDDLSPLKGDAAIARLLPLGRLLTAIYHPVTRSS